MIALTSRKQREGRARWRYCCKRNGGDEQLGGQCTSDAVLTIKIKQWGPMAMAMASRLRGREGGCGRGPQSDTTEYEAVHRLFSNPRDFLVFAASTEYDDSIDLLKSSHALPLRFAPSRNLAKRWRHVPCMWSLAQPLSFTSSSPHLLRPFPTHQAGPQLSQPFGAAHAPRNLVLRHDLNPRYDAPTTHTVDRGKALHELISSASSLSGQAPQYPIREILWVRRRGQILNLETGR